MLAVLLWVALAGSLSQAQNCDRTKESYPKTAALAPADTSVMKNIMCDMFAESCCTFITEFQMQKTAAEWGNLVTKSFKKPLAAVESLNKRYLYPSGYPDTVIASVDTSVKYNVPLNMGAITEMFMEDNKLVCTEDKMSQKFDIVRQYMQTSVNEMVETLNVTMYSLRSLNNAYTAIREYAPTKECQKHMIKSGVSTIKSLENNNCQVCSTDTADYTTCASTCNMVVTGCLNPLLRLDNSARQLLLQLDGLFGYLETLLRDRFLDDLEYMSSTYPKCFVGVNLDLPTKAVDESYYSTTRMFGEATLSAGLNAHCESSAPTTDCWTMGGVTEVQSDPEIAFTVDAQATNPLMPLTDAPSDLTSLELELAEAISLAESFTSRVNPQPEPTTQPSTEGSSTTLGPTPTASPTDTDPDEGAATGNRAERTSSVGTLIGAAILSFMVYYSQ